MWTAIISVACKLIEWLLGVVITETGKAAEARKRFATFVEYLYQDCLSSARVKASYEEQVRRLREAAEKTPANSPVVSERVSNPATTPPLVAEQKDKKP